MTPEASSTPTVLIIDDSSLTLDASQAALESIGVRVESFLMPSSGAVAATSLAERLATDDELRPSLILMDLNMPGVSGAEITRSFKNRWGLGIPIFLFSDAPLEELERHARDAGADGYISKGWGLERLCVRVSEILGR